MFNAFSCLLFSFASVIVSWAQLAQDREFWKTLEIITLGLETREGLSLPELAFRAFNQHMTIITGAVVILQSRLSQRQVRFLSSRPRGGS